MSTCVLVILLIVLSSVSSMPVVKKFGSKTRFFNLKSIVSNQISFDDSSDVSNILDTSIDSIGSSIDLNTSVNSESSSGSQKRKATDDDPNVSLVASSNSVWFDNEISVSYMYVLVKPLIAYVKELYASITVPKVFKTHTIEWGPDKHKSFKDFIVSRFRNLFNLPENDSYDMDSEMVDAAANFIKALSVTGGGTNFTANDYAKNQVILSFKVINILYSSDYYIT
jgi:hypothetical protein